MADRDEFRRDFRNPSGAFKSENKAATNSSSQSEVPKLPFGHCLVNTRWRGHAIETELNKFFTVIYTEEYSYIDFIPSQTHIVSVLTESDISENTDSNETIRIKFARLYKLANKNPRNCLLPMIIYHLTEETQPSFFKIQTLSVMDFSMTLIPLNSMELVPAFLDRIKVASRVANPFRIDRNSVESKVPTTKDQLLFLMKSPGLKEVLARKLLEKFGSVRGVILASQSELSIVLGDKVSNTFYNFINKSNT